MQIGTYSSKASGVAFSEFIRENGEEVGKVSYENEKDFGVKIKEIKSTEIPSSQHRKLRQMN